MRYLTAQRKNLKKKWRKRWNNPNLASKVSHKVFKMDCIKFRRKWRWEVSQEIFSLVQLSHSVVSDSLLHHGLQHAVFLSITNFWSLLKLMSIESVMPSSHLILFRPFSCPQSLPVSESFPMSQLFTWGDQNIEVLALASVLPMNTQDWSHLEWSGWISLQSKGLSRVFSNTTVQSINSLVLSFLHSPTLTSIHDHWKNHSLD